VRTASRQNEGQGAVEWIALVSLVTLLFVAVLAGLGRGFIGTGVANAVAGRLLFAAALADSCSSDPALVAAYGPELAGRVADNAPEIVYEAGMTALPVDFRSCRDIRCGEGAESGSVWASDTGRRATAFVHVVDCRTRESRGAAAQLRYDCTGPRTGNAYIQFWLYYADSSTSPWTDLPGRPGFHRDDWEGYQIRIGPEGADARATSHNGYDYRGGPLNWPSDAGLVSRSAWGESTGRLYVSDGSHAGHVYESSRGGTHRTPASDVALIPIESLGPEARHTPFAIVPPWRKPVYADPEDQGT